VATHILAFEGDSKVRGGAAAGEAGQGVGGRGEGSSRGTT
jgi:hypothetical protein